MEAIESVHQVEEAVICTLLSSESAIWQVAPVLKPEMFSDPLFHPGCSVNRLRSKQKTTTDR